MIAATPGMPAGPCAGPCAWGAPSPGRPPAAAAVGRRGGAVVPPLAPPRHRAAARAFGGERDHDRLDPRQRAHRGLGALAHALPLLNVRGIDGDREEHLAVGDEDVGKLPGGGERRAVGAWHGGKRGQNLILERCHVRLLRGIARAKSGLDCADLSLAASRWCHT